MKTLTIKQAEAYITKNYGQPRHNVSSLVKACQRAAKTYKENAVDLFFLLIENKPMTGTHSYGFHTGYGRELIEAMQSLYYQIEFKLDESQIAIL